MNAAEAYSKQISSTFAERLKRVENLAAAFVKAPLPPPLTSSITGLPCSWTVSHTQKDAIDLANFVGEDVRVFSFEKKDSESGKRSFLTVHPLQFWKVHSQRPPNERCFYEVIGEFHPAKLYLDLEFCKVPGTESSMLDGDALTDNLSPVQPLPDGILDWLHGTAFQCDSPADHSFAMSDSDDEILVAVAEIAEVVLFQDDLKGGGRNVDALKTVAREERLDSSLSHYVIKDGAKGNIANVSTQILRHSVEEREISSTVNSSFQETVAKAEKCSAIPKEKQCVPGTIEETTEAPAAIPEEDCTEVPDKPSTIDAVPNAENPSDGVTEEIAPEPSVGYRDATGDVDSEYSTPLSSPLRDLPWSGESGSDRSVSPLKPLLTSGLSSLFSKLTLSTPDNTPQESAESEGRKRVFQYMRETFNRSPVVTSALENSDADPELNRTLQDETKKERSVIQSKEPGEQGEQSGIQSKEPGEEAERATILSKELGEQEEQSGIQSKEPGEEAERATILSKELGEQEEQSGIQSKEPGEEAERATILSKEPGEEAERATILSKEPGEEAERATILSKESGEEREQLTIESEEEAVEEASPKQAVIEKEKKTTVPTKVNAPVEELPIRPKAYDLSCLDDPSFNVLGTPPGLTPSPKKKPQGLPVTEEQELEESLLILKPRQRVVKTPATTARGSLSKVVATADAVVVARAEKEAGQEKPCSSGGQCQESPEEAKTRALPEVVCDEEDWLATPGAAEEGKCASVESALKVGEGLVLPPAPPASLTVMNVLEDVGSEEGKSVRGPGDGADGDGSDDEDVEAMNETVIEREARRSTDPPPAETAAAASALATMPDIEVSNSAKTFIQLANGEIVYDCSVENNPLNNPEALEFLGQRGTKPTDSEYARLSLFRQLDPCIRESFLPGGALAAGDRRGCASRRVQRGSACPVPHASGGVKWGILSLATTTTLDSLLAAVFVVRLTLLLFQFVEEGSVGRAGFIVAGPEANHHLRTAAS
ncbi:unnamed protein product [Cyprideis torosa]|uniref:DNA-directed primase/polymerase protein n=1 Tax=Cyprideis torosa TaxID=163714 RepID=A0A7R8WDC4_9CRUS|nr:unnamed protein product [Cyprideis torosa]CAG0889344.1 unnamed protein product [Cyprideis torosa]